MTSTTKLWARWMRVAHKAAEFQGHVLFFLLYVVAMVPMGLFNPASRKALRGHASGVTPAWRTRESRSTDLAASRRQY